MNATKKNLISHIKDTFNGIQNETQNFQQVLHQITRDEDEKNDKSRNLFNLVNSNKLNIDLNYLILNLELITKSMNFLNIEFQKQNFQHMSESIINMLDSKMNILIYDANLIKKQSENFKELIDFRRSIGSKSTSKTEDEIQKNKYMLESSLKSINSKYSEILIKLKSFYYDIELIHQTYFYYLNEVESPIIINLKNRIDELSKSLESNLKYNYKEIQNNLNSEFSQLESKFNLLSQKQYTVDKSYIDIKENFVQIQDQIHTYDLTLEKSINDSKSKINSIISTIESNINNDFKVLSSELVQETDRLKRTHKDFLNLVEKSGVYELTQNYKLKAKEENTEYKNYRNYTTFSILGAIVTTIIVLLIPIIEYWGSNPPVDINYYSITARMSIALMFFVLAIYLARQATKHYEIYQENHKTFLQLSALEPFISKMSDADKLAIRKELVPIYFNKKENIEINKEDLDIDIPKNFHSTIDKLLDIIQSHKK